MTTTKQQQQKEEDAFWEEENKAAVGKEEETHPHEHLEHHDIPANPPKESEKEKEEVDRHAPLHSEQHEKIKSHDSTEGDVDIDSSEEWRGHDATGHDTAVHASSRHDRMKHDEHETEALPQHGHDHSGDSHGGSDGHNDEGNHRRNEENHEENRDERNEEKHADTIHRDPRNTEDLTIHSFDHTESKEEIDRIIDQVAEEAERRRKEVELEAELNKVPDMDFPDPSLGDRPEWEKQDDYVSPKYMGGGRRGGRSFDDGFARGGSYYGGYRHGGMFNDSDYIFVDAHVLGSPVLADVNNDGKVEVLVAVSYYFYKEQYEGKELDFDPSGYVAGGLACWDLNEQDWTWMVHLDLTTDTSKFKALIYSTPTVADIDGDPPVSISQYIYFVPLHFVSFISLFLTVKPCIHPPHYCR